MRWHRTLWLILWTVACWVIYVQVLSQVSRSKYWLFISPSSRQQGGSNSFIFRTLDKLSPARCKRTWQGAIFSLTHPPSLKYRGKKSNLTANIIDLSFFFSDIYTQQGHFNYIAAPDCFSIHVPTRKGYLLVICDGHSHWYSCRIWHLYRFMASTTLSLCLKLQRTQ